MKLLKLKYDYLSKIITSKELIAYLEDSDFTKFKKEEQNEIENLIEEIKRIQNTIPNEIDDEERERIQEVSNLLEAFEKSFNPKTTMDKDLKEFISERIEGLKNERDSVRDCGKLYEEISKTFINNHLINDKEQNLNKNELLELITENFRTNSPVLKQETFDELATIAIKKNNKEKILLLALNYVSKNIDLSIIEEYFIKKKDIYYIVELMQESENNTFKARLIEKIIKTGDKNFMRKCYQDTKFFNLLTDEQDKIFKNNI